MATATATGTTDQAPSIMTPDKLAHLPPADRANYFAGLDAAQRSQEMDSYEAYRATENAKYLAGCVEKVANCPPTGAAGATKANITPSQSVTFEVPTAQGAFAVALRFILSVNLTFAAGTGATYELAPSAPYSLIDTIEVLLNGRLHRIRPVFFKYMEQMRGFMRNSPGIIVAGNTDTNIQNALYSTFPVAAGTTTWTFYFDMPLRALHDHSAAGCVPIMGSSTHMQVQVNFPAGVMGADPLLFPVHALAGTGNAVTLNTAASTITAEVVYMDGENYFSPTKYALDLDGEPTAQYSIDTPLNNLTSGSPVRQKINSLLQHHLALAFVIDGNQSNKYAALSNIQEFALTKDAVGQNVLWKYGTGTNVSTNDFFWKLRRLFGQDLPDEGVIPLVVAWAYGQQNPSNREGLQVLNLTGTGWSDIHHEWTVGAVTTTNMVPRVELLLLSLNPDGLNKGV